MELRIAVDLRTLLEPFESGVTVYTREMVRALMNLPRIELDLFYQSSKKDPRIHQLFPKVRHIKHSNSKFHFRSLIKFPRLPLNFFEKTPDLIWIPDRRPFYRSKIPLVMTIHDLVPELYRTTLSIKGRVWHRIFPLRRLMNLCDAFITPSYTTSSKLKTKKRVEVAYEGASLSKKMEKPKIAKQLKHPFFLVISPADPRKRLKWVIKMAKEFPRVNFLIAGYKKDDSRFSQQRVKKLKNLIFLGQFSEGEKLWLLKNTKALLALSEYEGFDLPVLEAVRAKCSVIMSDISVHRELYKTRECFVTDLPELRAAIYRALHGNAKIPVPRGNYTWEAAAKRASLFFRHVVVNKNR